jgi:hypothetical protein
MRLNTWDQVVVHRTCGPSSEATPLGQYRSDPLARAVPGAPVSCRQKCRVARSRGRRVGMARHGDEPLAEGLVVVMSSAASHPTSTYVIPGQELAAGRRAGRVDNGRGKWT